MFYRRLIASTLLVIAANACQAEEPTPVRITGADLLAGKIRVGFHVPYEGSKVQIAKDGVDLVLSGVYLPFVDTTRGYTLLIDAVVPDRSSVAIHFPFQGKMIKLWVHRAGDGGSPSVGVAGDKFPLTGWSIAHKLPLVRGDRLKISLSVEQARFEYHIELPDFPDFYGKKVGFVTPTVKHVHTDKSKYEPDLPKSLVNLNNAILLDADHLVVKELVFQGALLKQ